MAKAKQPVSIDGIEFDALIEQSISYEADVPEYPTEDGFSVSDTVSLKPETLSMILYVTNTPVTWKSRFGSGTGRVENVVKKLEQLYFAKKVFKVATTDAVYNNMVLTSMSISKSPDVGYAREIPITLKKIVVTKSKTVNIPTSYGKSGTSNASAGTASKKAVTSSSNKVSSTGNSSSKSTSGKTNKTNKTSSKKSGSILYNAASSVGLI